MAPRKEITHVGETLPFRMRRNSQFLVPTRRSRRVDQLCLLPLRGSTAGSPEIAKGSVVPFFFPISLSLFPPSLPYSPFFFPFLFSFFFSFLLTLPTELFDFLQVRGSFLSLYYSSFHVLHFPWSMCHMNTCSRWHSPHHMALMPCVLLLWHHVAPPHVSPDTRCLEKIVKF